MKRQSRNIVDGLFGDLVAAWDWKLKSDHIVACFHCWFGLHAAFNCPKTITADTSLKVSNPWKKCLSPASWNFSSHSCTSTLLIQRSPNIWPWNENVKFASRNRLSHFDSSLRWTLHQRGGKASSLAQVSTVWLDAEPSYHQCMSETFTLQRFEVWCFVLNRLPHLFAAQLRIRMISKRHLKPIVTFFYMYQQNGCWGALLGWKLAVYSSWSQTPSSQSLRL